MHRSIVVFVCLILVAGAITWYWVLGTQESELGGQVNEAKVEQSAASDSDPRLTFATSFRNVRPGIEYVGDSDCQRCHEGISSSFHAHPMGMSARGYDLIKVDANNLMA